VKRKVKNWEEYPLEDISKVIYSWVKTNIITKIRYYNKYPWMIRLNLKHFLAKTEYYFLSAVDPAPIQEEKESTDDYFERIDPKYGLRFYKAMVALNMGLDFKSGIAHIEKVFKNDKRREQEKKELMMYIALGQQNIVNYKKYLTRSEILKKQNQ